MMVGKDCVGHPISLQQVTKISLPTQTRLLHKTYFHSVVLAHDTFFHSVVLARSLQDILLFLVRCSVLATFFTGYKTYLTSILLVASSVVLPFFVFGSVLATNRFSGRRKTKILRCLGPGIIFNLSRRAEGEV